MRRVASLISFLSVCAFGVSGVSGCATYRQDLDRARKHYDENQHEKALALFRVLEIDMDSFSDAEQAQYAYLRGMADYRLSTVSLQGTGVNDPRKAFRDNARHWLAVSAAIEKNTPGGLTPDEKKRLEEALTDLNKDVYGGAESVEDKGDEKAKKDGDKKADPVETPAAPPK